MNTLTKLLACCAVATLLIPIIESAGQHGGWDFTIQHDSAFVTGFQEDEKMVAENSITNTSGDNLLIRWEWVNIDMPDEWYAHICIRDCYDQSVMYRSDTLMPHETVNFDVHFYINGVEGQGLVDISILEPQANAPLWILSNFSAQVVEPVEIPDQVILNLPADESTGVSLSPLFEWLQTERADRYHLVVSEDDNIMLEDSNITGTTFQIADNALEPLTTYQWRVRAGNESGYGDWSESWSFETGEDELNELTFINSADEQVRLYPNPAHNHFNIDLPISSDLNNIQIFNMQGADVTGNTSFNSENTIVISNLPEGLYLVRFQTEGSVITRKLIKR